MKNFLKVFASTVMSLVLVFGGLKVFVPSAFGQAGNTVQQPSRSAGRFYAASYGKWAVHTTSSTAAAAATINVDSGQPLSNSGFGGGTSDARPLNVFQNVFPQGGGFIKISVDSGANNETVTLTGSSGCTSQSNNATGQLSTCSLTASSFANAHGAGAFVFSGTFGLQEAINDAAVSGGGVVVVDQSWSLLGGTTAMLAAASVAPNVTIEDDRTGPSVYWSPLAGATTLAAPATLTATTVGFGLNGANTTGGAYTGGSTYHVAIACVDLMGQEGPASADFSALTAGSGSTNQIGFSAPAAQTGCVGYTIYISLAGGSYTNAYKVPLVSQPSVVGTYPVSNGVCTLTTIETTTPACAVTNTTYGQTGSAAIVSALTLNTSPIVPQNTVVATTSVYPPNAGGRTTYTYTPSAAGGAPQLPAMWLPFVISAADATTVPSVIGTINVPPQYMNVLGKTLRICGYGTTTASTATIEEIQLQWDSMGQNTAGKGVLVGDVTAVATWATAGHIGFCQDLQTTATSASATGGSMLNSNAWAGSSGLSSVTGGGGGGNITSTTGSLNLAADARINVIYVHTTGTDGAAITLQSLSARVL